MDKLSKNSKDLNNDLNQAIEDARDLLKRVADEGDDKADELRRQAKGVLSRAFGSVSDAQDEVVRHGKKAANMADDYVHDNPWTTTAIAGVAGLLLGVIIARR